MLLFGVGLATAVGSPVDAQVTAADYQRAEQFLSWNLAPLVDGDEGIPHWLTGGRFWYRRRVEEGHEFIIADARHRRRSPAFDHQRLAEAISQIVPATPHRLPFYELRFTRDERAIQFRARDSSTWTCGLVRYHCEVSVSPVSPPEPTVASPDGAWLAFVRHHNLWVRNVSTGAERQLSVDGVTDWGYATHSEGWTRSARAILLWSPDSRKIATFRLDERGVRRFHVLETTEQQPVLRSYSYALPGDSIVPTIERYVFDLETGAQVRLRVPPGYQRATSCCGVLRGGHWTDVQWSAASDRLYFVCVSRDYRNVVLIGADPKTGEARTMLREQSATYFESNLEFMGEHNWRVFGRPERVLWFSERDGWGHLYLYDGQSGALLRRLTAGPWTVGTVVYLDEANGIVYFTGRGREVGRDPYLAHLYRVRLDGTGLRLLTPEDGQHDIAPFPDGDYFLDRYSRVDAAPRTVVRDREGNVVLIVDEANLSRLLARGWQWPERFTVKARDGRTDLYGILYWPSTVEAGRRYPLIVNIYPGPQIGSVSTRRFTVAPRGEARALAELGFVVMQLDALGTPLRSKAFHDAWYGDMGDNGLADQVAAVRQLGQRYPSIDIERVGIYGSSGGGYAAAAALLRFPEVFKVGVAISGNHDNRGYAAYWGERFQGPRRPGIGGEDPYASQASARLAGRLEGKLLLIHGTTDDNVNPNLTLHLVDRLIATNRDFDLLLVPNRAHGLSRDPYLLRRTWDYFVTHLLGQTPPTRYQIRHPLP